MIQRILVVIGVLNLLAVIALSVFIFSNNQEVVYVDSGRLLNEYRGMIDARVAYKVKADAWKANIDTLANEVQKRIVQYERAAGSMSVKERSLNQDLIRAKQREFAQYQQAVESQAQAEDEKITKEVVNQVNNFLEKYGRQNGYTVILAATEYGNLAYAEENLDITEDVLNDLNSSYEGK